jgi:hypothetical protein
VLAAGWTRMENPAPQVSTRNRMAPLPSSDRLPPAGPK